MVEMLRADPDSVGLTTALGWYVTKHAVGVWSTRPPDAGFRRVDPRDDAGAASTPIPAVQSAGLVDGPATIEATSVAVRARRSPASGIVTARTDDGARGHRDVSRRPDLLQAFTEEAVGRPAVCASRNDDGINEVVG